MLKTIIHAVESATNWNILDDNFNLSTQTKHNHELTDLWKGWKMLCDHMFGKLGQLTHPAKKYSTYVLSVFWPL